MHFQSLILLALSAGALAIPSKHHTNNGSPTIAPYNDGDCTQQAGPAVDFLNSATDCIKIDFSQDNVGINWGDWPNAMTSFYVFSDDACQDYAWARLNNTGEGNDATGANACYSMRIHGGPWKSVQKYYPPVEGDST